MYRSLFPACSLLALISVSACDPVSIAVGTGSAVGVSASEERGLSGTIEDTKIKSEIDQALIAQDVKLYANVNSVVSEGRVQLTGSVAKPDDRVDAVRVAWQAAGVREVIDEIQVTDQSGFADYGRDVRIATTLRGQMLFDKDIRNINYTVDVVNSVVYLMGIAQNQDELNRVIAHARDISGVTRVISHVILKTDPSRSGS